MAKFRRIVQAVRETINWLNLPFDIHTILSYARKLIWPLVLAVLTAAIGFFRDAPFAQVVVTVVLVFVVVYIFVLTIHHLTPFVRDYLRQKGLSDSADTGLQADAPLRKSTEGLEEKVASARKRKAANDLLGNALEEGESLKQGRSYALESENQDLEDIEIGHEYQGRYYEEVRGWVDHTYDLIDAAYGRTAAQRFISNEGYTDQELLGRKLPSFLHVSSTQRKYSLRARLKRLHELTDRMHNLDINPDFDPDEWRNR